MGVMSICCHLPSCVFPLDYCACIVHALFFYAHACHMYTQLSLVLSSVLCSFLHLPLLFWVQMLCLASISWALLCCFLSVKMTEFISIQNNMQNYCFVRAFLTFIFLDRFWTECYEALFKFNQLIIFPLKQFFFSLPNVATVANNHSPNLKLSGCPIFCYWTWIFVFTIFLRLHKFIRTDVFILFVCV
jgi:hypothetical protein